MTRTRRDASIASADIPARVGAAARRIEQELFVVASGPRRVALIGGEIGGEEMRVFDTVAVRVLFGALHESGFAFDADDLLRTRASGSVKLPRPQKRSSTRSVFCGSSRVERALDHAPVHAAVDLDEIERPEFDVERTVGKRETSASHRRAIAAATLSMPPGCRKMPSPFVSPNAMSAARSFATAAADDGTRAATRSIAGGDFDLRDVALRFERFDHLRDRGDARSDRWMQHVAGADVGDEASVGFAEADQHAIFLLDELDAQPALAPIAPRRIGQRRENRPRAVTLPMRSKFSISTRLFRGDLRGRIQMLQRAAAAYAEMRTARHDAIGRGLQHFFDDRLVVVPALRGETQHARVRPASAPATNTALPSTCATPRPSCVRSVISASSTVMRFHDRRNGHKSEEGTQ